MNLFNQINCRIVDSDEKSDFNILRGIDKHYQFLIVIGGEFALQHYIVRFLSENTMMSQIFTVAPISPGANIACYVLGAMTLLVNLLVKKIPVDKFDFIQEYINLEDVKPDEKINVIMQTVDEWI